MLALSNTSLPTPAPSSSTSSSTTSPPLPTPPIRKARPCSVCKVRRVKCNRSLGLEEDCDWCRERGARCVTDTAPYRRKGKRISEALATFGTASSSSSRIATPARTELLMASKELSLSLGYHLVEVYFEGGYSKRDSPHFVLPCCDWRVFKEEFENAGRDPTKLSPCNQVISFIIFANASRVSQHSAIAGHSPQIVTSFLLPPDCPPPKSPPNSARNSAYQALINKATQLCDEFGIWRTEAPVSQEAMLVMLLMHYLLCDGDLSRKSAKHYSKSAIDLLRLTYQDSSQARLKQVGDFDGFAWVMMVLDACSSAETGEPPRMTDLDIQTYIGTFPAFLQPPSTSKFIVVQTIDGVGERFWQPWFGALKFITDLARAIGLWKRSGMGGRLGVVEGFWRALKEVEEWSKVATMARKGFASYLKNFSELYTGLIWTCAITLYSIIRDHLDLLLLRVDPTLLSENDSFAELVLVSAMAEQHAKESVSEFIHSTKASCVHLDSRKQNERGVYILTVVTGTLLSVSRLVTLAKDFLKHLQSDSRSILEKRSGLEFLYRLLIKTYQSWPEPALGETITEMVKEIFKYEGSVSLEPGQKGEVVAEDWHWDEEREDEEMKEKSRIILEWAMLLSMKFLQ